MVVWMAVGMLVGGWLGWGSMLRGVPPSRESDLACSPKTIYIAFQNDYIHRFSLKTSGILNDYTSVTLQKLFSN